MPADKTAMSDAVRRFGQGPASSGDMAVRLRSDPEEPVSLGLAGVRGLGEAAVLLSLADTTEETRLKKQVAQATGRNERTARQHASAVYHKAGLAGRAELAAFFFADLMLPAPLLPPAPRGPATTSPPPPARAASRREPRTVG